MPINNIDADVVAGLINEVRRRDEELLQVSAIIAEMQEVDKLHISVGYKEEVSREEFLQENPQVGPDFVDDKYEIYRGGTFFMNARGTMYVMQSVYNVMAAELHNRVKILRNVYKINVTAKSLTAYRPKGIKKFTPDPWSPAI